MDIIYYATNAKPEEWLNAFEKVMPRARLRQWQEGDDGHADYALVWKPPVNMLKDRHHLKAIFNLGAGVDAILAIPDLPPNVPIIRVEDAGMGVQMAEYVSYAVLQYFRRFDTYDTFQHKKHWQPLAAPIKSEYPVGILGLGVLGQCVAHTLASMQFPLHAWSRTAKSMAGVRCYAGMAELDAFLKATRILVVMLPLTDETQHLLNYARLSLLQKGSYVINVARGAHIVENDLLQLIQEEKMAGACLDVFETEPLPTNHPFWHEKRIRITPHISALTLRDETACQIAQKMMAVEQGQNPHTLAGVVDRNKGY